MEHVSYRTLEEAVELARSLAPRLRERVPEAEHLRRLPDGNVADLLESGLLRLETPLRWGGAELNTDALIAVTTALSEGCGATGWVYAIWAAHVWHMAQFPEPVQEMVLTDPDSMVSAIGNTIGEARRVDGGYILTGKGRFSSGCDQSNWMLVRVYARLGTDDPLARCWILIPRSDFEIEDDWYTVGLRGTGSKSIIINEIFVPEDRLVIEDDAFNDGRVGALLHKTPLFCADRVFTLSMCVTGPALGIARSMVRAFEERCRSSDGDNTPGLLRLAKASAQLDAAEALVMENARRFCYVSGSATSALDRAKCERDVAYSANLCRQLANDLFEASGSNSVYDKNDFSRLWRDSNVATAHLTHRWDVHGLKYGTMAVG